MVLKKDDYESLTDKEYRIVSRWRVGKVSVLSRSAYYRFKRSILNKTGIDISILPIKVEEEQEFKPIYFRISDLTEKDIPDWYKKK